MGRWEGDCFYIQYSIYNMYPYIPDEYIHGEVEGRREPEIQILKSAHIVEYYQLKMRTQDAI